MSAGELFSVRGKTVLVTGGTRGIGYMIAEGYLRAGARKVYISSRKADACQAARDELAALGEVEAIPADVSDEEQCEALIGEIASREDKLEILVNNAGATWGAAFDEFPGGGWDKVLGVNLKAPFVLTQKASGLLKSGSREDDPARVLNIGSIDGMIVPTLNNYSYSAAKAGIHHLTRHLAADLSPEILVNAIAPGPFPSRMTEKPLEVFGDQIRAASPLGRVGEPDDVAAASIFLSSRASNYITGAVIPLDGGLSTTLGIQI